MVKRATVAAVHDEFVPSPQSAAASALQRLSLASVMGPPRRGSSPVSTRPGTARRSRHRAPGNGRLPLCQCLALVVARAGRGPSGSSSLNEGPGGAALPTDGDTVAMWWIGGRRPLRGRNG